ncbi:MAG TPA: amidohydrolase family protein [Tepidisphaeraceae bacterium]|jgi:L-fuconolactonase|nr:amidohydrolase family protein [Tepidisphaeraceae bacterium]
MVIDSHQHFWKYDPAEYGWIEPSMSAIRRDFLPEDLRPSLQAAGVDGVICVQARQSLEETHWLLRLANDNPFVRGVVGWAPLVSDHVKHDLETVGADPKLRGIRHVLQGESDEHYMDREDFNRGLSLLKEFGLTYDLLILARQLPQALRLVDRHPRQVFVLDHIAKPNIKAAHREPWAKHIGELARRTNVYCKVSGMVNEADWQAWTEGALREYFDVVLGAFGAERLIAASDWPVCLVACGYKRWWEILRQWTAGWSSADQQQFVGLNAAKAYGLK